MPHGDFSDLAALTMLGGGFLSMYNPNFVIPGLAQNFPIGAVNAETDAIISFMGGFMLIIGCMLFTVRWNTINGKMSGLAMIGCAVNMGYVTFKKVDNDVFLPRPFYVYAAALFLGGLHLMFNANPMQKLADKTN